MQEEHQLGFVTLYIPNKGPKTRKFLGVLSVFQILNWGPGQPIKKLPETCKFHTSSSPKSTLFFFSALPTYPAFDVILRCKREGNTTDMDRSRDTNGQRQWMMSY
jgi:hypothetical protein